LVTFPGDDREAQFASLDLLIYRQFLLARSLQTARLFGHGQCPPLGHQLTDCLYYQYYLRAAGLRLPMLVV